MELELVSWLKVCTLALHIGHVAASLHLYDGDYMQVETIVPDGADSVLKKVLAEGKDWKKPNSGAKVHITYDSIL